ncbi:type II secretion system F family protein [Sanguibacter sp. A247]|uniref:type II secretion system F family protein n=1 Tax=unclassified Sanguibacter TaxID=2645534 RepID=UPI003FD8E0C5
MFTPAQVILMSVGTIVLAGWIYLFIAGRKHAPLFEGITEKEFPLKDLYPIGYELLERTGYSFRSRSDLQLRQLMDVLFTRQYAEFYMRAVRSQQVTFGLTLLVLSFGLYGITGSFGFFVVMLVLTALAVYYYGDQVRNRVRRRGEAMYRDFCEMVSSLALLTNAGMILREAWTQTSLGGDTVLYEEMQLAVRDMQNGTPDTEAIQTFGARSMLPEIKRFTSTLVQSVQRGGADLPALLTAQSTESWHLKKQAVQREGNKAGSKLLFPMILMFAGILIMLVVPMFLSMGI